MILGFDHLAITVENPEATARFYAEVLGAELHWLEEFRAGRFPVFSMQLGAQRVNVHPASAPVAPHARHPTAGSVDLCLRWEGPVEAAVAQLEGSGVAVEEGPVGRLAADGAPATSVYFRDPDGNLLELLTVTI